MLLDRRCPHCEAVVRVPADRLGRPVRCDHCQQTFTPPVPIADALPADADAELLVADEPVRVARPTVPDPPRPQLPDADPPQPQVGLACGVLLGLFLAVVGVFAFLLYVILSGFANQRLG